MYDYIEIIKQQDKDKVNLSYLKQDSRRQDEYYLFNQKPMRVSFNRNLQQIKISGSIPYFLHGHNFSITNDEYIKAIPIIEDKLNICLSGAMIERIEYGHVVEAGMKSDTLISMHILPKGVNPHIWEHGRSFEDSLCRFKLYNAKTRQHQNTSKEIRRHIEARGFDNKKEWVKAEVHYFKPHIALNSGRGILISELVNPEFESKLEKNFMHLYGRMMKIKTVKIPNSKKQLKTSNIIALVLEEVAGNYGKSAKELLYSMLHNIPDDLLSKNDKKARQAQLRKILKEIQFDEVSKYDLTEKLKQEMKYLNSA